MFSYPRRCEIVVTGVWSTAPASMRRPNTWGTLSCHQGPLHVLERHLLANRL